VAQSSKEFNVETQRRNGSGLGQAQGWQIETVDSGFHVKGGHTSLALDSAGRPHIVYPHENGVRLWDVSIGEEVTELVFVVGVGFVLWAFRRGLFRAEQATLHGS